ncbi:MAG TPA: Rpn family recombination-promoting nuclease/putative transposase [Gammaproteobacteria bacterium]|nr:Rpn family recombination-promoting nuclease/putative transposase [Gammaproteobacteria bacterium]
MPAIKNRKIQKISLSHTNPHDSFFAQSLSDLTIARDFLEQYLPKPLLESLDLTTLEICKDRIVDGKLRSSYTDVVYRIKLKEGSQTAYIINLIEHQSTPRADMPVRVLLYESGLIKNHWDNHKEVPLVYSTVFYNGKEAWYYPTHLKAMINAPPDLIDRYAFQPFQLIQLNHIPDEVLKEHLWSGLVSLAMKHIYDRDILPILKELMDMLQQAEQYGRQDIPLKILYYFAVANEVSDSDAFNELINSHLSYQIGESLMTLVEQYRQKGRVEGIAEGRVKGIAQGREEGKNETILKMVSTMLKQGYSSEAIAKITGLTIEEIHSIT